MRKYSKKGWERRKREREGYKEFFEHHINNIKKESLKCEECSKKLIGVHSEVCHILPKSYFKSIATNNENIIYLCPEHHNFFDDRRNAEIKKMKIFDKVENTFEKLREAITETLNYKHYDRYNK